MDTQDMARKRLLEESKIIAIVGLSPDEEKPSNMVGKYLKKAGYKIIPVNPQQEEILGEKSYKNLSEITEDIDIVDIFMRGDKVLPVVEEAISIKPKAIWLQLGIINEEARTLAQKSNIPFYMNLCIKQEHSRLLKSDK